jgi:hypothetical protein
MTVRRGFAAGGALTTNASDVAIGTELRVRG